MTMLRRPLPQEDTARKFVRDYSGLAILWVMVALGEWEGEGSKFSACGGPLPKKRQMVTWPWSCKDGSKTESKGAKNGCECPGNERCEGFMRFVGFFLSVNRVDSFNLISKGHDALFFYR